MQAATLTPLASLPGGAAALDEPAEWEAFGRALPDGSGAWESYLAIEGIHCPGCSLVIEQALLPLAGVRGVEVNGATATARVVWLPQQGRPSQWLQALERAGYGALPAGDQLAAVPRRQARRLLLWRWLVAGFCMMQVMMYAVPAYVAEPGDMTPDIAALLRWASWLLTLPVLLFSCQPFFASAWRDLRARRIGMDVPVALGIAIAFGASSASTFDPQGALGGEVWYDSVTMFVFFLLSGRLLEQRLRDRTAGALEALLRRLPQTVERLCADGGSEQVSLRRLAAGDRIRVRAGEVFPADGRVLEGTSRVDEALLTGEATPLARSVGDAVVAGSHNLTGTLVVAVERTGEATRYAEIVALMERASVEKPAVAKLADRIASPFLAAVIAAAAGAAWWWWPQGPGQAIAVAVAVLIVTCPCALSLATPAATLAAAGALARRGVLVRGLEALESGAAVDTVVFDKTGTLTQDRMAVQEVRVREGVAPEDALRLAAALAGHSLHPVSRALAAAGAPQASEVQEHAGEGVSGVVAGRALRLGSARFCAGPAESVESPVPVGWVRAATPAPRDREELGSASLNPAYEAGAVPVVPVGWVRAATPAACADQAQVHLADDSGWLASFTLDEDLRPGARDAVEALRRTGIAVEILSGDQTEAVARLAQRAGIPDWRSAQNPQDKLARVAALQRAGRRVAMVGDGMNDGPVLARADLSVAMGQGVPVAQARADFIVQGNGLEALPLMLRQARRTRAIVRQNLAWAAAYNAVCVPLALAGQMPPWLAGLGMAASSVFVVVNAARLSRIDDR